MYWSLGDTFNLHKYICSFSVVVKCMCVCVITRGHRLEKVNTVLLDWILSSKCVKMHNKSQTFTLFISTKIIFFKLYCTFAKKYINESYNNEYK